MGFPKQSKYSPQKNAPACPQVRGPPAFPVNMTRPIHGIYNSAVGNLNGQFSRAFALGGVYKGGAGSLTAIGLTPVAFGSVD